MSDNTTPSSPVQRTKKSVETTEFDAFARRILRAYGRRVADGDIEALRCLATFAAEIDTVTRAAVTGLRQEPYSYSWSEIASRLGVTKQAVQMRYGTKPDPVRLDQRLIDNGLNVSVALLVSVFADHHPGVPAADMCPGCGYRYPEFVTDCPTNATVRPLLYRRRRENTRALKLLTPDQFTDLHSEKSRRTNRPAAQQAVQPMPSPQRADSLLDLIPREDSTP